MFLCLEFYSKFDRSDFFVNNSNRPTGRLLELGLGLMTNPQTDKVLPISSYYVLNLHTSIKCIQLFGFQKYPLRSFQKNYNNKI